MNVVMMMKTAHKKTNKSCGEKTDGNKDNKQGNTQFPFLKNFRDNIAKNSVEENNEGNKRAEFLDSIYHFAFSEDEKNTTRDGEEGG